jgi:hypothetical protein
MINQSLKVKRLKMARTKGMKIRIGFYEKMFLSDHHIFQKEEFKQIIYFWLNFPYFQLFIFPKKILDSLIILISLVLSCLTTPNSEKEPLILEIRKKS